MQNCQSCQRQAQSASQMVDQAFGILATKSSAADFQGAARAGAAGGAAGRGQSGDQLAQTQNGQAGTLLGQKASAAGDLARVGQQCAKTLHDSCGNVILADQDKQAAEKALQGCEGLAQESAAMEQEKAKGAGGMEGLAQAAQGLAGLLGQLMKPKEETPEAPKESMISGPPVTSDLGSSMSGGGKVTIADGTTKAEEGEERKAASTVGSTYGGFGDYGGNALMPSDSSAPAVAEMSPTDGAGVGAGAGTGSGDSSGSSTAADADAAMKSPDGTSGFEVNLAGGGKGGMLGLKGRGTDLADLGLGENAEGSNTLDLMEEEDGSRELASGEVGITDDNEATIFRVVHSKYKEIKQRGNI
jgi:hypothetical protein